MAPQVFFYPEPSRRGIRFALWLSMLAHALVFALAPRDVVRPPGPMAGAPSPMTVVLVPEAPAPPAATPPMPAPELPKPGHREPAPPKPALREAPASARPPEPQPAPQPAPQFDMLAYVNANRERRRAAENALARSRGEAAPPREAPPEDPGAAGLSRNLQSLARGFQGTSGIFQILRMGPRTAEFSFNGWRPEENRRWREVIEVDAGAGGDVELAVVRRMIELIRTHYSGDFNWESHRLGRVVVLSARPADTATLEDFLAREFFGTPVLNRRDPSAAAR